MSSMLNPYHFKLPSGRDENWVWLDFYFDPTKLDRYLQSLSSTTTTTAPLMIGKKSTTSATDLLRSFLEQIGSTPVTTSTSSSGFLSPSPSPPSSPSFSPPTSPSFFGSPSTTTTTPLTGGQKRINVLFQLSAKLVHSLKMPVEDYERLVPLKFQRPLFDEILSTYSSQHPSHRLHFHRWVIRSITKGVEAEYILSSSETSLASQAQTPTDPSSSASLPLKAPTPSQLQELLKERETESLDYLQTWLSSPESLPPSSPSLLRSQVGFELGESFFFHERFQKARECFQLAFDNSFSSSSSSSTSSLSVEKMKGYLQACRLASEGANGILPDDGTMMQVEKAISERREEKVIELLFQDSLLLPSQQQITLNYCFFLQSSANNHRLPLSQNACFRIASCNVLRTLLLQITSSAFSSLPQSSDSSSRPSLNLPPSVFLDWRSVLDTNNAPALKTLFEGISLWLGRQRKAEERKAEEGEGVGETAKRQSERRKGALQQFVRRICKSADNVICWRTLLEYLKELAKLPEDELALSNAIQREKGLTAPPSASGSTSSPSTLSQFCKLPALEFCYALTEEKENEKKSEEEAGRSKMVLKRARVLKERGSLKKAKTAFWSVGERYQSILCDRELFLRKGGEGGAESPSELQQLLWGTLEQEGSNSNEEKKDTKEEEERNEVRRKGLLPSLETFELLVAKFVDSLSFPLLSSYSEHLIEKLDEESTASKDFKEQCKIVGVFAKLLHLCEQYTNNDDPAIPMLEDTSSTTSSSSSFSFETEIVSLFDQLLESLVDTRSTFRHYVSDENASWKLLWSPSIGLLSHLKNPLPLQHLLSLFVACISGLRKPLSSSKGGVETATLALAEAFSDNKLANLSNFHRLRANEQGLLYLFQATVEALHHLDENDSRWLLGLGDAAFELSRNKEAVQYYLKALAIQTSFFTDRQQIAKHLNSPATYRRIVASLRSLKGVAQAVAISQYLPPPLDSSSIFKMLQDEMFTLDESYFQFIWDHAILEFLLHMYSRAKEERLCNIVLSLISKPELNQFNPPVVRQGVIQSLKATFFQRLFKEFLLPDLSISRK